MPRTLMHLALACGACLLMGADWLQFRGPNGASATSDAAPPAEWDESTNVAWRADLPGRAASSPIVVDGRVVVTSSSGVKQDRLHVLAFDEQSGDQLWERQFWATGRTLTHPFSAVAAPTPASDGERIFAFFSSNDLVCLDLDGNLIWYRGLAYDYPKAGNDIGMASSPVVVGDTVVVQVENQGDSFAAGIDTATGETRWRIDRDRRANWVSPIAMPGQPGGRDVVILQSGSGVSGHDAKTGEQLWKFELNCGTTPSPVAADGRIYIPANGLTALDLPEDASTPSLAWNSSQLNPSPASPIVAGERVYTINSSGVLTCGDTETGRRLWQVRVGGRHWATPVLAGERIYCFDADGVAKVVQIDGDDAEVVSEHEFAEPVKGSPAVSNGALYVRTDSHLWKIAQP